MLSRAFSGGTETSLAELALLMGLEDGSTLDAAVGAADFIHSLDLELVPSVEHGEFESSRVLRSRLPSQLSEILSILEAGESISAEFKSSLLCSMRDWQRDGSLVEHPSLPGEVLKTICAFLNTDGGDLLIGADDDGKPSGGIQRDLEVRGWSLDKWQLHLASLVQSSFRDGDLIAPYLDIRIVTVDDVPVAHVRVVSRESRSFVRREKGKHYEYFIRNASRTDSLDLPAFYEHLAARAKG